MNPKLHQSGDTELPLACVVMLTYNGSQHLEYALPSLRQTEYRNLLVLVVDNHSEEDISYLVSRWYPEARVIRNRVNLWWAGGNNVGVQHALAAGAEYICLVNDDVLFDPRWLASAVKACERFPDVGIVGFEMYDDRRDDSRAAFDRAVCNWHELSIKDTQQVSGAAMLVRRCVFEHIGFFDKVYQAYCEENDFESRAMRAGYRMIEVNVPIWHHSGGTFDRVPMARSYLSMRNILRYGIKNRSMRYTLWTAAHILRVAADPFTDPMSLDRVDRRYRPKGPLTNLWLAAVALLWNVLHLPETLARRRIDKKRIEERSGPCASC